MNLMRVTNIWIRIEDARLDPPLTRRIKVNCRNMTNINNNSLQYKQGFKFRSTFRQDPSPEGRISLFFYIFEILMVLINVFYLFGHVYYTIKTKMHIQIINHEDVAEHDFFFLF